MDAVLSLTTAALKRLGVKKPGHLKKFRKQLDLLREAAIGDGPSDAGRSENNVALMAWIQTLRPRRFNPTAVKAANLRSRSTRDKNNSQSSNGQEVSDASVGCMFDTNGAWRVRNGSVAQINVFNKHRQSSVSEILQKRTRHTSVPDFPRQRMSVFGFDPIGE